MKKKLAALLSAALAIMTLGGCLGGKEHSFLTFEDASGKGTMRAEFYISLGAGADNGAYVKDVSRMAQALQTAVNEVTGTQGIYTVEYAGKTAEPVFEDVQDGSIAGEILALQYSFDDINDYNRKTMRLYNVAKIGTRGNLAMPREYPYAAWHCEDAGDGTYRATFSQDGVVFSAIYLWAYDYLMENDIDGAWDNTGSGNYVQYNPFKKDTAEDMALTIVSSLASCVTLKVGEAEEEISPFAGEKQPQTVELTGTLGGTPVSVTSVADDLASGNASVAGSEAPQAAGGNVWPVVTAVVAVAVVAAVVLTLAFARKKK